MCFLPICFQLASSASNHTPKLFFRYVFQIWLIWWFLFVFIFVLCFAPWISLSQIEVNGLHSSHVYLKTNSHSSTEETHRFFLLLIPIYNFCVEKSRHWKLKSLTFMDFLCLFLLLFTHWPNIFWSPLSCNMLSREASRRQWVVIQDT